MASLLALLAPAMTIAQGEGETTSQIWGNFVLGTPVKERLYVELDLEPKLQIDANGGLSRGSWYNLDATSMLEYYPWEVVDLTAELVTGVTRQSRTEDSYEASVRLGFRLHLVEELLDLTRPDRLSGRRFGLANFARLEWRNVWYSTDRPSSQELRFRNRLEFKVALNANDLAADGVWYAFGDGEVFATIHDEIAERFATKARVRLGVGHRVSSSWRFEILVQGDAARDTLDDPFDNDLRVLDFRVKRIF